MRAAPPAKLHVCACIIDSTILSMLALINYVFKPHKSFVRKTMMKIYCTITEHSLYWHSCIKKVFYSHA